MNDILEQSQLYQRFKPWYDSRSARDQRMLKVLAVVVLLLVVLFGVLLPAIDYRQSAQQHYQESLDNLSWMQANRSSVRSSGSGVSQLGPDQSLLGVANQTAKGYQLNFKRYQPLENNGLGLWMDGVSFNKVILWLERLDRRYGITVKEISVDRQEQQGVVNLRLVLEG